MRRLGDSAARRLGDFAIALLAIASSAIGIINKFTYDDRYVIELNPRVQSGLHQWWTVFGQSYWTKIMGGDGYRPLTILSFKLEYALGHGSAIPFHAANILLYAATAVMVLYLTRLMLPAWAAFAAAALFAVHPVHVEAVANVVGQSELLVALFTLPAVHLYISARRRDRFDGGSAIAIALLYAAACFTKENGIVLPALLVAAELTVIDDRRSWRERVRATRPFYLGLAAIAIAYVGIRSRVLADHDLTGFQPFMPFASLHTTAFQRVLTAVMVVPEWARLFYWPAMLSTEYGPPDMPIAQGPSLVQLPGLILLLAILALAVMLWRRRPVVSFGIAFVCISLLPASNFLVPAGILLAERTLFLPSVGAMLLLGDGFVAAKEWLHAHRPTPNAQRAALAALLLVLGLGAARSISRTQVWRDNETLFHQSVIDSPRSYRAHYMLAAWSFEKNRKSEGEREYRTALELFPYDPFLAYNLAEQYRASGACKPALPLYEFALRVAPDFPLGHTAYAWCLLNVGRYAEAKTAAWNALKAGGSVKIIRDIRRQADSAQAAANVNSRRTVSLAGSTSKVREPMQKTAFNGSKPRYSEFVRH